MRSSRAEPSSSNPRPWRWAAVPGAILLVALAARLARLGDANVWWDEALAVWALRKGLVGATLWTAADVHPPLFFWTLWGWVQLVGESEFAMRLLSAGLGVLTVAAVYALGRLVAGRWAGVVGALLIAVSRFHVWWSQELRMYVLAGLLGTLSLLFFLRWLRAQGQDRPPQRQWALLLPYVLASLGALYTIFLMGAVLLVENVVVLAALARRSPASRRRALLAGWVPAQLAIAAPVIGWLSLSWGRMRSWSVAEPVSLRFVARLYATLLTTGISTNIEQVPLWLILVPLGILAVGLGLLVARSWRRPEAQGTRCEAAILLMAWGLPALAVYLAAQPRSLFYTPRVEARYLLPFAPAYWALLGVAVVEIGRRARLAGVASGVILVALAAWTLPGHYADRVLRDELQTMVRAVWSQAEPGDVVLLDSGSRYPIFDYYYAGRGASAARPEVLLLPPDDREVTPEAVDAILGEWLGAGQRVWLAEVDVTLSDPERLVRAWLAERYALAASWAYGHNALLLFDGASRPPALAADYAPQHADVAGQRLAGGTLRGWELPVERFAPGDGVHVALLWDEAPIEPLLLTLRDTLGRTVLATEAAAPDQGPGAGLRQQLDLTVTPATPSGALSIWLRAGADEVLLGSLRVSGTEPPAPQSPAIPLQATFDGGLTLEGARLSAQRVRPGGTLILDLYWRGTTPEVRDLVVFSHLLGEAWNPATEGPVWAGHDARPGDGGLPVALWPQGEVVADRHLLTVDPAAPEGTYRLEVGLYDAATGVRLSVTLPDGASADHLLLANEVRVGR